MKVAIIGSGNSGCAHAAKLSERRHEVRLVKTSHINEDNFNILQQQKGIYYCNRYLNEEEYHFAPISLITHDVKAGIQGADVILVLTQSLQHPQIAELICPYLEDGQIVLIIPGNLGSFYFKCATSKNIIFAEGESTPYDARITAFGKVDILFKNVRNAIAFLEQKNRPYLQQIDSLFDSHKYLRTNIIESAMHNPNMVVHTIGSIMSASRIEMMQGEFWMYRESFSPAVWNIVKMLDEEKNNVITAYKGKPLSYVEACRWRNEKDLTKDPYAVFRSYAQNGGPKGPANLNTRFIHEDVPMGLCALESLAKKANIDTRITSSLINIASSLVNVDFRSIGRTVESLGIATWQKDEIIQFIS